MNAQLERLSGSAASGGRTPAWAKLTAALTPLAPLALGIGGAFTGAAAGITAFGVAAGPVIKNAVSATQSLVTANSAFDNSAQLVHVAITTNTADLQKFTAAQAGLTGPQRQVEQLLAVQGTRWQNLTGAQRNAAISLSENKKAVAAMLPDQAAALKQLVAQGQAYNQLTPAQRAFGVGLSQLETAWKKMQTAITPALLQIAAEAMKQIAAGMAVVGQMSRMAAPGVGQLVSQLLSLVNNVFRALEPAVRPGLAIINQLVSVLSGTLVGVVKILAQALLANTGNIKSFVGALGSVLGAALKLVSGLVGGLQPLMGAVVPLMNVVTALVPVITAAVPVVAKILSLFSAGVATVITAIAQALAAVIRIIPPSVLGPIAVAILAIVAALKAWAVIQGVLNVLMDANPIGLIVIAIAGLIVAVVEVIKHWHALKNAAETVFRAVLGAVRDVWDWIKAHWPLLLAILTGPVGLAAEFIIRHWHDIETGTEHMVSSVINWFRSLPGRILRALGDLGHLLWSAGVHLVEGLISGIESKVGDLLSTIGGLASKVGGFFGSILGIGSPSKVFAEHGRNIVAGLVQGLTRYGPQATEAMRRIAVSGMPGAASGYGGALPGGGWAGGGSMELTVRFQPTGVAFIDSLMETMRAEIRHVGGGGPQSVQIALGRTH